MKKHNANNRKREKGEEKREKRTARGAVRAPDTASGRRFRGREEKHGTRRVGGWRRKRERKREGEKVEGVEES